MSVRIAFALGAMLLATTNNCFAFDAGKITSQGMVPSIFSGELRSFDGDQTRKITIFLEMRGGRILFPGENCSGFINTLVEYGTDSIDAFYAINDDNHTCDARGYAHLTQLTGGWMDVSLSDDLNGVVTWFGYLRKQ